MSVPRHEPRQRLLDILYAQNTTPPRLWNGDATEAEEARILLCHQLTDRCNYETRIPIDAIIGDAPRTDYHFIETDPRIVEAEQMAQGLTDGGQATMMQRPGDMEEMLVEDMYERGMSEAEVEAYLEDEEEKYDAAMGTNMRVERRQTRAKKKKVVTSTVREKRRRKRKAPAGEGAVGAATSEL